MVKANIWNRVIYWGESMLWQLARHEVTDAPADQRSRAGKTVPLICHLIPPSTGLQWQSGPHTLITPVCIQPPGSAWASKQMKPHSRPPEILARITADKSPSDCLLKKQQPSLPYLRAKCPELNNQITAGRYAFKIGFKCTSLIYLSQKYISIHTTLSRTPSAEYFMYAA